MRVSINTEFKLEWHSIERIYLRQGQRSPLISINETPRLNIPNVTFLL